MWNIYKNTVKTGFEYWAKNDYRVSGNNKTFFFIDNIFFDSLIYSSKFLFVFICISMFYHFFLSLQSFIQGMCCFVNEPKRDTASIWSKFVTKNKNNFFVFFCANTTLLIQNWIQIHCQIEIMFINAANQIFLYYNYIDHLSILCVYNLV